MYEPSKVTIGIWPQQ